MAYKHDGNKIMYIDMAGDVDYCANCDSPAQAVEMLNKAKLLNDARKYTASARLHARVRDLPGFEWRDAQAIAIDDEAEALCQFAPEH